MLPHLADCFFWDVLFSHCFGVFFDDLPRPPARQQQSPEPASIPGSFAPRFLPFKFSLLHFGMGRHALSTLFFGLERFFPPNAGVFQRGIQFFAFTNAMPPLAQGPPLFFA